MSVGRTDSVGPGEYLNVIVVKDDRGYGMTVSGNDPVVVQSVVKQGAAWRAGVRTGDRILSVNNISVETSVHNHVVTIIRASPTANLLLLRQNNINITAPVPVGREAQRQLDITKVQTIHLMLENENRYIENLRSSLARDRNERKHADLLAAQGRREKLQQQANMLMQNMPIVPKEHMFGAHDSDHIPPATPPKQGFLSNLPRSLSSLTGQSIKGLKHAQSQHQQQNPYQTSPVTCLDGATINTNSPPPLPPRLSPATAAPPLPPPSPGSRPAAPFPPNSMAAQMNYPLVAVTHPPIQGSGMGHQRSKSSPEELNKMNNSNDDSKDWEAVNTPPPPGTPPPPYPIAPQPQVALDPQRAIISMEEDDTPSTLTRSMFTSSGGFSTSIESLSTARQAIFLNWLVGEQRPPQAALLYFLAGAYASGPPAALARWAYEIHSVFLVPDAPLALSNVDENLAREIDDALIMEHDKEEVLRKIFLNARERAKEELSQQLIDFQKKRQSGLSGFYGPTDSVLDACDSDKSQETSVIMTWLLPRLANWVETAAPDTWSATKGSPTQALLAATVPPLLHHTFGLKPQAVSIAMGSGLAGASPRPSFLQRDKLYKQRIKHINKIIAHPLVIRGHHFSPLTITSVSDCQHCHLLIWGIAPQAYNCSDCKLRVHRSCSKQVEESCCGPAAAQTRISRLMEKLTPAPLPMGNSHQYVDNNQHHHEKKQRKSLGTSHFLNMERSSRKNEDDSTSCLDNSASSHHSFSGDGRRDDESGADSVSHLTDSSHFTSDHGSDRTETSWRGGSNLASKPVTRAESYRDRADRVKRTKRKTSDPNQLTSAKDYHDAEAVGGGPVLPGGPSGGSSNSSLSSKSNDSSHIENHGSQSEWSDEEEDSSSPWSALAPPELLATMSGLARKRQDLIHELISSEASHVRWLRVLRRVFLTPLQRSGGSLLPSNELKNLFPNLPDVLQRHKRLAVDLKNLKANAATVRTKPLAEALVTTLGEARYAGALAKFCGGQGLALEALRERRKRNKELNAFLARSEQDPLCTRLRLQDLLACVWQRLTKYQLLLEGIVKTAGAEEDLDPQALEDEDFARVAHALHLAKDVLHTVNTAIKTTENDHRLKCIQSKLDIRGGGDVEISEEIRKIDLTKHSLIMEGTLSIRQEYNKRVNVLALLLRECLVLLHTDGEKYVLRPIPQTNTPFSPLVKWNTALFRPNAAVKNGFFLVNIENMHMYELSATSPSEYNTWKKHLREAAKALEGKGGTTDEGPPPPLPSAPPPVSVTTTVESVSNGSSIPAASSAPSEEGNSNQKPASNEDDGNQVSGALQSVVGEEEAGLPDDEGKRFSKLLAPEEISVVVPPTTMTAHIQLTPEERLRRAEEKVTMALSEAAEAVKLVTGSQRIHLKASTEQLVGKEFTQQEDLDQEEASMSTEQLVMIAQSHVNSLTEVLLRALRVSSSDCSMTKCGIHTDYGLCDSCSQQSSRYSTLRSLQQSNGSNKSFDSGDMQDGDEKQDGNIELKRRDSRIIDDAERRIDSIVVENIGESSTDPVNDVESTKVSKSGLGLRRTLSILERRLISCERERELLRARLQQADNRIHRMHQLHKDCLHNEEPVKQEACQPAVTANSTDQSGGEG